MSGKGGKILTSVENYAENVQNSAKIKLIDKPLFHISTYQGVENYDFFVEIYSTV